jgi:protein involved in polysaccharide export with SLBB domain
MNGSIKLTLAALSFCFVFFTTSFACTLAAQPITKYDLSFPISGPVNELSLANWRFQDQSEAYYRIRPKELLRINIEDCACQCFGDTYEVDDHGDIHGLAFIEKDAIPAAGKTTAELADDIVSELKKYLKNPKVNVALVK